MTKTTRVSTERGGSRDYPTHTVGCGCSGCHHSNVTEHAERRGITTGYLSAVDATISVSHDYQTARLVLRAGGITRDEIVSAGLSEDAERRLLHAWDDKR